MNTPLKFYFVGLFISLTLFACQSDPTATASTTTVAEETPSNTSVFSGQENMPSEVVSITIKDDTIAMIEEETAAEVIDTVGALVEKTAAELKEEKRLAEQKERRRKRREARRKAKEEKLAKSEKLAKTLDDPTLEKVKMAEVSEDLSDIDPDVLAMVQSKGGSGKPLLTFFSDTYNFGRIQQGEEIDHQFKFKNTGTSELVIKDVKVSCGCTMPSYPFIPIGPGETGQISVHFNSKGRLGSQKPTITVYSNTKEGTHELHLEGVVDAERAAVKEDN